MMNSTLIKMAREALEKVAVQPPEQMMQGDPSMQQGMDPTMMQQGGQMPPADPSMDPSMAQQPPMDPSQQMMPPPSDPSMGGGADPMGGASGGADLGSLIRQIIQEELAKSSLGQQGPGGSPQQPGKPGKPDLLAMSMDLFQMKKMITTIMNALNIPMPQDILDGPNRDPSTGAPMPPGAPNSTSDPNRPSEPMTSPQSSIKPIEPLQGAFPSEPGAEKAGSIKNGKESLSTKAAALSAILKKKIKV